MMVGGKTRPPSGSESGATWTEWRRMIRDRNDGSMPGEPPMRVSQVEIEPVLRRALVGAGVEARWGIALEDLYLVLGFGFPEITGGRDLGCDLSRPKTGGIDVGDRILSDALLFLAGVEDRRAIACPDVNLKKEFDRKRRRRGLRVPQEVVIGSRPGVDHESGAREVRRDLLEHRQPLADDARPEKQ